MLRDIPLDFGAGQSGTVRATHLERGAAFSARTSGLWPVAGSIPACLT